MKKGLLRFGLLTSILFLGFTFMNAQVITGYDPTVDATDVPVDKTLTLTFDQAIQFNPSGTYDINILSPGDPDPVLFETFTITNGTPGAGLSINSNQLIINASSNYNHNTEYYVSIPDNAISGFSGILDASWSFTTEDAPAPPTIVLPTSPQDDATEVSVNTDLVITFNENIKAGSGSLQIYRNCTFSGILPASALISGNQVTISNSVFVLEHSTNYYIRIDAGFVKSVDTEMDFEGISDNTMWNFTTEAAPTPPTIVLPTSPEDDAIGVPVNTNLVITFNENIIAGNTGLIKIKYGTETHENINWDQPEKYSISGSQMTITPDPFTNETEYHVLIDPGFVKSVATGASFDGINDATTWNFTTEAAPVPPTIVLPTTPADDAAGVSVNTDLVITFSEEIAKGSGVLTIFNTRTANGELISIQNATISGNELFLTIDNVNFDLEYSTDYFIKIDPGFVISVATGASFDGINDATTWNFTTEAAPTPPTIVFPTSPADDAIGVSVNTDLVITFSEEIVAGETANELTIYNANTSQGIFTTNAANASISGDQLTLTVNNNNFSLSTNTPYYIKIDPGFVKSLASGIDFPGIDVATIWNFTTSAPLLWLNPNHPGLTNQTSSNITLVTSFNRNGNLYYVITPLADAPTANQIKSGQNAEGNQAVLNNTVPVVANSTIFTNIDISSLKPATKYYVYVVGEDNNASFSTVRSVNFSTRLSFTFNPADGSTGIDFDQNLVITAKDTLYDAFGHSLANGTITNPGTFIFLKLTNSTGANVPFTAVYDSDNFSIIIDPTENLLEKQLYYYALNIDDAVGENYSPFATFTTKDVTPPAIETVSPANGSTAIPLDPLIKITFTEDILFPDGTPISDDPAALVQSFKDAGDNDFTSFDVSYLSASRLLTITLSDTLTSNTKYIITLNGYEDISGNETAAGDTIVYTTDVFFRWNGSNGTSWSEPSNWDEEVAPTGGTSIYLPAGKSNYPILSSGISVNNLTLEPGASLTHTAETLTVLGIFRLKSSPEVNASYLPQGGTLSVSPGNVRFEQVVTSINYQYTVSSPVSGATKNSMGLTNNLYYYNNPSDSYSLQGNTTHLETGRGYVFRNDKQIVFTGAPHSGIIPIDVIRTPNQGLGWNLIGNPFSATINWNSLTKTNVESTFWMWINHNGFYGTYNGSSGIGVNMPNSPSIPSHQAIWVKVPIGETSGSVTFTTDALEANTISYLKSGSTASTKYPTLKLAATLNNHTDETAIALASEATNEKDEFDSDKFFSNNRNFCEIFTLTGNQSLAINGLPQAEEMEIPLGYSAKAAGPCELSIALNTLPENSEVFIKDKTINTLTKITDGVPYPFEITAPGKNTTRFALVLKNEIVTGIKDEYLDKVVNKPYIYANKSEIVAFIPGNQQSRYQLFGVNGRMIDNGILLGNTPNRIAVSHRGMVILRIEWEGGIEEYKAVF